VETVELESELYLYGEAKLSQPLKLSLSKPARVEILSEVLGFELGRGLLNR